MSIIFKRISLVIGVILAILPAANANAINSVVEMPETILNEYAQNNILYYNPYECEKGGGDTALCTAPSGKNITWIGDSYSNHARKIIEKNFPGITFGDSFGDDNSYVQSCKFVSRDTECGANPNLNPSGFKILRKIIDAGELKPYLVFALGTNGGWHENDIETFEEIMSGHNDTKVILVNSTYPGNSYARSNNLLKEMVDRNDNFYLADWAAVSDDSYFVNDPAHTHPNANGGYEVWFKAIKDAMPKNCSAGLLPGSTVEEKIWNYLVQANIEGISDNQMAIAGILGNFAIESGYNPFLYSMAEGSYYHGLHMLMDPYGGSELKEAVDSAVGRDVWMYYYDSDVQNNTFVDVDSFLAKRGITEQEIDAGITASLDFYFKGEVNGVKVQHTESKSNVDSFIRDLDKVTNKTPTAYAELFLVWVERAVTRKGGPYNPSPITDPGVAQIVLQNNLNKEGGIYYQGTALRSAAAEDAYKRLSGMSTPTTTSYTGSMSSGGSNVTATSSSGYTKYDDLTDSQIIDLAEVALAESSNSDKNAFRNYLTIMVNIYEEYNSSRNGPSLVEYVKSSEKDIFSKTAYMNGKSDITKIPAGYIDAARDILVKGNRTLPEQVVFFNKIDDIVAATNIEDSADMFGSHDSWVNGQVKIKNKNGQEYIFYNWVSDKDDSEVVMGYLENNPPVDAVTTKSDKNDNSCPDSDEDDTIGGMKIAEAAVKMAWPVQANQGDDAHIGQCEDSSGKWVTYTTAERPCKTNERKLYKDQLIAQGRGSDGKDCGFFVGTVLQYVGAIDKVVSTYDMQSDYFRPSDDWEEIENKGVESMEPGDVLVANGSELGHSTGHIFFFVGSYGGSYGNIADASLGERVGQVGNLYNDTVWHIWRYKGGKEGLNKKQAERLVYNYNNNVGNWDGKVAGEGNYCHGSECASRYSNCVLFSAFFLEKFVDGINQQGWPNGGAVVAKLKNMGFETNRTPEVFSIFSYPTPHGGHTGVVIRIDGDTVVTAEAGWPSWPGDIVERSKDEFAMKGTTFAHVADKLDYNKLMDYINQ